MGGEHHQASESPLAKVRVSLYTDDLGSCTSQVTTLVETAERLSESHPDARDDLQRQQTELKEAWDDLMEQTEHRKQSLNKAQKYYQFFSKAG